VALLTENESSKRIPQFFDFCGIFRRAKAPGHFEKSLLLLLLGFDAVLNKFHQDTVVAKAAALGEPINLSGDLHWKTYAAADMFAGRHDTTIHHCGALGWLDHRSTFEQRGRGTRPCVSACWSFAYAFRV
jgi:hypothetical protein